MHCMLQRQGILAASERLTPTPANVLVDWCTHTAGDVSYVKWYGNSPFGGRGTQQVVFQIIWCLAVRADHNHLLAVSSSTTLR